MFRYGDRVQTRGSQTLRRILLLRRRRQAASQWGPKQGPLAPHRESKRKYFLYYLSHLLVNGYYPYLACDRSFFILARPIIHQFSYK